MKFTGKKCPVCEEIFENSDDVVVCPDCGTPYHRECYAKNGECIFRDKHGMDFENPSEEVEEEFNDDVNVKKCPRCSHENREEAIFCDKCGLPLIAGFVGAPHAGSVQNIFDPMGGVNPSEPFSEDITAGDVAKLVQAGTPYYMNVFKKIKDTGRSRFNFAALFFSGGWLLYRKQYKAGLIVTAIIAVLMILSIFFSLTYSSDVLNTVIAGADVPNDVTYTQMPQYMESITRNYEMLSNIDRLVLMLPVILDTMIYVINFVLGFIGNRLYYKHCIKTIKSIKHSGDEGSLTEKLQLYGGVNTPVAFILIICYFIINYLPYYLI